MTEDEVRQKVVEALLAVAPEIDAAAIDHHEAIRQQFDIDSVDLLNFVVELESVFAVRIPETDYARIATIAELVGYLSERVNGRG